MRKKGERLSKRKKTDVDMFFSFTSILFLFFLFCLFEPRKHRLRFLFSGAGRGRLPSLIVDMSSWTRREVRRLGKSSEQGRELPKVGFTLDAHDALLGTSTPQPPSPTPARAPNPPPPPPPRSTRPPGAR